MNTMNNRIRILIATAALFLNSLAFSQQKIMGFTDGNAVKELELEKSYDGNLNAKDQDSWMLFLTSHPHHVGSPQDKANAEYIASLFRSWGYQTELAEYDVLFPTPKFRSLDLLGAKPYKDRKSVV